MADARKIVDRVRSYGANLVVDEKGLRVINGGKLPQEARNYLAAHKREIALLLTDDGFVEREERAAIIQFEGKTPREWVEQFADILIARRPDGVSELDWSWFLTRCGQIIDEAPRVA